MYSWLLIPRGYEVLSEGPAQMIRFTSIFLHKTRLEKVQGSNRECKMSNVPSSKDKTIKLPGKNCLYGSEWLHCFVAEQKSWSAEGLGRSPQKVCVSSSAALGHSPQKVCVSFSATLGHSPQKVCVSSSATLGHVVLLAPPPCSPQGPLQPRYAC